MIPQDVITSARYILNDEDSGTYRWTNAELLVWCNDFLDIALGVVPQYFTTTGTHTCSVGAEQTVSFTRFVSLVPTAMYTGNAAITLADRDTLDKFSPSWRAASTGTSVNWMPHENSDRFYLYPPPSASLPVVITYVAAPTEYGITDTLPLPDTYQTIVTDFVAGMAMTKEDEASSESKRTALMSDAAAKLKGLANG